MDPWAVELVSAPAMSLPGTLMESHQISLWWQGLAGQFWKPLRKLVEKEGFHEGHSGMTCCLMGANGIMLRTWQLLFFRD